MNSMSLKVWVEQEGKLLRLRLNRPKANIVDAAMIAELRGALREYGSNLCIRAVLLDAEGPHFSFGASVQEHLPESAAEMLSELHALILEMLQYPIPVLVVVRGQCLGGGLEVASAGHLIFAAPDAVLGQPEIKISVFAPAASCLLQGRLGPAQAQDLLFSGRSIKADEAYRIGLVQSVTENPEQTAITYFTDHIAPLSGCSLRYAVRVANVPRSSFLKNVKESLAEIERIYNEELVATHDAMEGLTAFLEKRPAVWKDC